MIRPDVIVTWPRNADYPLWRKHIRDNRAKYDNIIIVFHETNQGHDYRAFVKEAMFPDFVLFVDPPPVPAGEDWRNWSVNHGLRHSLHNPWIYFTEQDFFPSEGFWKTLEGIGDNLGIYAVKDADRLHPCSIFIKREILEQTSKDFSARPEKGYDHFGRVQQDIKELGFSTVVFSEKDYKHYNGLSHNFTLISDDKMPNYEPKDFIDYLTQCVQADVPLDSHFVNVVGSFLQRIAPEQEMLL